MKVLLVVPRLNIGGAESYVYTLATGLKDKGIAVVIASGGGYLAHKLSTEGIQHFYCPIRLNKYIAAKRLASIIQRENITLVHANSTAAAYATAIACKQTQIPWVMTAHGVFGINEANKGIKYANKVICVSDFLKKHLLDRTKMDISRFTTIYNGVDLKEFNNKAENKDFRTQWNLEENDFVVALIGRMATLNGKGHYDMINAMASLPNTNHWKLLVVGKGKAAWRIKLKSFLAKLGNRIKFVGHQTDIPNVIRACDLLILPSKIETFGLVLAEAMAMGKPVIAYEVGGTSEAIEDRVSGFLVPKGDAAKMFSLIDELNKNRELLHNIGQNGMQRVQSRFNSTLMVEKTIAVYKTTIVPPQP